MAAVARFHDSRFQGVRLVCRLRRGTSAASSGQSNPMSSRPGDEGEARGQEENSEKKVVEESVVSRPQRPSRVPDRYFIVKSLTLEDLELSRRSGIWATQTHNEAALNRAYEVRIPLIIHIYTVCGPSFLTSLLKKSLRTMCT